MFMRGSEVGIEPVSYTHLLKPEFKGQISFAYPYTSGTAYTILATVVQLMGEDEGFKYMMELDKNVHCLLYTSISFLQNSISGKMEQAA